MPWFLTLAFRVPVIATARDLPVVPICRGAASLILPANHRHLSAHPVPLEGRFAIVTDVGLRDAVDVSALQDEESAKETVKTIARGMPGVSGVTVVTMLVCFLYFAREAAGASRARHSLRPLIFGRQLNAQSGRIAPRDRGVASWRHCEEQSDEAIHSFLRRFWIASLALAMTVVLAI